MKQTAEQLLQQFHRCANMIHRSHHLFEAGDCGMHHGQGKLLSLLLEQDGLCQRELCERMQIRAASLSELLDKLERTGSVERRQSEGDRRVTRVYLTEVGRENARRAVETRRREARQLFAFMPQEEQAELLRLLQRAGDGLAQGLEQQAGGPCKGHGSCRGKGGHKNE